MRKVSSLLYIMVSLTAASVSAQTPPVRTLINMETKSNAAGERSNKMIPMPHFEIPLKLLTQGKEINLDDKIYESLVFKKNNRDYVRWVINPEDTKWFKDVEAFMNKHSIKPEKKTYFKGYQTASRSYIVVDPVSGSQFSIKTSTDQTGGAWRDKKQQFQDGFDILMISDFMSRIQKQKPFENLSMMHEPLIFGIESIDQSIVVRELGEVAKNRKFLYVPGFSVLHEETGKKIAELNGSNDPADFWMKNYVEPMAKAAAEVVARTGIWFDSPHSQNFLIEMTPDYKPTGRIVLRDLGDIYLNRPILEAIGEGEIARKFSAQENVVNSLSIAFGPLHGNQAPSWVSKEKYNMWADRFAEVVGKEFENRTGLKISGSRRSSNFSYFGVSIETGNSEFSKFRSKLALTPKWCRGIFAK